MSKVLFINGPASGHVNPTLGLVEELVAEGEEIVYLCGEQFRGLVERPGVTFIAYDNFLEREDPFDTKHFLSLVIKILSAYDIILPCVRQAASIHSFDYLIHDSMYGCGQVVADMLGIPHIATCTSLIRAERLSENAGSATHMKDNLQLIRHFAALAARIRAEYGIRRKLEIDRVFFNEGLLNLVFTSDRFQPDRERLGSHYKFVGPSLTDRRGQAEMPPIVGQSGRKLIYISMGTMFNDVAELYRLMFEALASFDGDVFMAVGTRIDLSELRDVPGNFTVAARMPQLEILRHADLFITHGGMNSVNEALYHGVPLIVIPMAADQPINGDRVQALSAGLRLNRDTLTGPELREAVDRVLASGDYKMNSVAIGETLRAAGGHRRAMAHIRAFKEQHRLR
ncbi:macrolide family glycosyltransferase [Paenibacillus xanthanilyticus]|uniref:Macrolide family glycosyltransferase n=1 Tax=Paenibacillus xanthanilyticus TaxID=1783531 RepID=A0ABV8K924_9BACL